MSWRVDWVEGARIAVASLKNHRLRTGLTTLGVGIGVATLLAIVGIIQGLDSAFDRQLASMGSSALYVTRMPWITMSRWEFRDRPALTLKHAEVIRQLSTHANAVSVSLQMTAVVSGQGVSMYDVPITGTLPDEERIGGWEVLGGRFLAPSDSLARNRVAVIGLDVANTLFGGASPLGRSIRIENASFTVVGLLDRKGQVLGRNLDATIMVPYEVFLGLFGGARRLSISVGVKDQALLDAAEDELVGIMRRARGTPPGKKDDFSINRPEQLAQTYNQLTGVLYGVAVGIGFITLLVGGIGIMNIMLVSVRERTREIGVRRALGAKRRTIVLQFILEAIAVSAVGGLLGTFVGLLGAMVVSWVTPLAATVKPLTVLFGVGFAALVGLVFGIFPAWRAAHLDPVEALRHE